MSNDASIIPAGFEPNLVLRTLSGFFDAIQVDPAWVRQVRALSRRGSVVYVLRNLNPIDCLALDHLTKRYDLPRIGFANELPFPLFVRAPNGSGSRWPYLSRALSLGPSLLGFGKTAQSAPAELRAALAQHGSAVLCLKRAPSMLDIAYGSTHGRGLKEGDELLHALIELQRENPQQPVLLVPQVFLWTNRPDTLGLSPLDTLLGPREWPSSLRALGQLLYNYRHVAMRAGEPLDLSVYLQQNQSIHGEMHVRRLVYVMLRRLERERLAVTGPALTPPDRQRHQVLRSPKLQKIVAHLAGDKPEAQLALKRKVLDIVREMQATPDSATLRTAEVALDYLFHHVYAGIAVDREGIEELRKHSKSASFVLLPSHKSHTDYLVVSYVFHKEHLPLPLIAAGDNLSFFPLGPVFRRMGAFFIRRQFGGDRLYSATVEAYVRRVIRDGRSLELFIEGGRSRTGKLLKPQLGLLGMVLDAALSTVRREVLFVPISIGYERIAEAGAYGRELLGAEKPKEDARGLLLGASALRHHYGRIDVQFGKPLSVADICRELSLAPAAMAQPAKRRAVLTRLGNRVLDEINRVTAVAPGALTALVLLSDEHRSISHEQLLQQAQRLLRVLQSMRARISARTVLPDGRLDEAAITDAAQMFVDAELVETHRPGLFNVVRAALNFGAGTMYRVPELKRIELDVSKNLIVHFFAERALVAITLLKPGAVDMDVQEARDRTAKLAALFKHEFRYRTDDHNALFDATLAAMQAAGEVNLTPAGRIELAAGHDGLTGFAWLHVYSAIVRNFVEAYRVAARGLTALLRGPLPEKDLVKRTLTLGHRMYLAGEIERHEALSKPTLQNAFVAFKDEGYIQQREGKYRLTPSFDSPDAVTAIEDRVAGYLERTSATE